VNELIVTVLVVSTLVIAYLWVYPRVAGNEVKKMMWLDVGITAIPLAGAGLLYWSTNPPFRLVFFDTNWFVFGLVTFVVLEIPLFILYLKARGLGPQYLAMFREQSFLHTSIDSVNKSLDDTRWDGLRTKKAQAILLAVVNLIALGGAVVLWWATLDSPAVVIALLFYVLLLLASWYLLRQAVRLIADAPDEALDERTRGERDRSYLPSYRALSSGLMVTWVVIFGFSIGSASEGSFEDPYVYQFDWIQLQLAFWVFLFYVTTLPSMSFAWNNLRKGKSFV
jgi:hypothetical protein